MSITRNFTVYLHSGMAMPPVIHVNQYDQGETWVFTLLDSTGAQYTPSTGALIGVKSDGHAIAGVTGTINASGQVVITETQQMTAAAGKAVFELTIDGGSHGTANFIVEVEPKPTDGAVLSDSDLSIIQQGMNAVTPVVIAETVSDWLEDNLTDPPIDPSLSISNAAADAKVTGDRLTELKTNFNNVIGVPVLDDAQWVEGAYVNVSTGAFTPYGGWHRSQYIDIGNNEGKTIHFTNTKGVGSLYNLFYDANHNKVGSNFDTNNTDIVVPTGARYFVVSLESTYDVSWEWNITPLIERSTKASLDQSVIDSVRALDVYPWNSAPGSVSDGVFTADYGGTGNIPAVIVYIQTPPVGSTLFDNQTKLKVSADLSFTGTKPTRISGKVWASNRFGEMFAVSGTPDVSDLSYDSENDKVSFFVTDAVNKLCELSNWANKYIAIYIQPRPVNSSAFHVEISNIRFERYVANYKDVVKLNDEMETILPAIPSSLYNTPTNEWAGSNPRYSEWFVPIVVKKKTIIKGISFTTYFTSACDCTITIRDINGSKVYASQTITIDSVGKHEVSADSLMTVLDEGEYTIFSKTSAGETNYPLYSLSFTEDEYLSNNGTKYWGNNQNIRFVGIIEHVDKWEKSFNETFTKAFADDNFSVPLVNISMNNPTVMDESSFVATDPVAVYKEGEHDIVINYTSTTGNVWFTYLLEKEKLVNNFYIIDYDVAITDGAVRTWLMGTSTSNTPLYLNLGTAEEDGHVHLVIDLNYYAVYNSLDLTKDLRTGVGTATAPCSARISNFTVTTPLYTLDVDKPLYENLNIMHDKIEQNSNEITVLNSERYLTSPNGEKYIVSVSNDGSLHAVPTIPNHTLFMGNSLLVGNGDFGMCASDYTKDYYYLVTQHILGLNPNATFAKLSSSSFEASTTIEGARSWMQTNVLPLLGENVNLVIIQLGDNVNTSEKLAVFQSSCGELIQYVKENAPNARVAWAGEWYSTETKQGIIAEACSNKGATFIDMTPLHGSSSNSYIGAVVHYKSSSSKTYTVNSYTDDTSSHELTITMTIDGRSITSVLPYTSYQVDGNTITVTGEYGIVTQAGVASHPGDLGFERIADLMIEKLGL